MAKKIKPKRRGRFKIFFAILLLLCATLVAVGTTFDIPASQIEAKYALQRDGQALSKFADVAGTRVHFTDRGAGPALLLLHGIGSSLHTWEAWVPVFAKDFRVITLDLPGFGLTGPNRERKYMNQDYTRFLSDFMKYLGIPKAHVVGSSLGGQIAWEFAARYPEKTDRLILLDAAGLPLPKGLPGIIRLARIPVLRNILLYANPKMLARQSLREIYWDKSKVDPELIQRYTDLALREGNRQAFIDRVNPPTPETAGILENISAATLVIWGKEDAWIPLQLAGEFVRRIANARSVIFEHAGHVPHEELPDATAREVMAFLKSTERQLSASNKSNLVR